MDNGSLDKQLSTLVLTFNFIFFTQQRFSADGMLIPNLHKPCPLQTIPLTHQNMQIFKTNKKLFWANELKSWLWTVAFSALLYVGLKQFSSLHHDNIIIGVILILLLKLADTLTQYHIVEIQIDNQNSQLIFILHSIMSGEKIKKYELSQASSQLINNSGLTKYLSAPFVLKIFLSPKDTFSISNKYGFSLETLISVDKTLRLSTTQS